MGPGGQGLVASTRRVVQVSVIRRVRVENFQSVQQADVELGKLTVIVGPSNTGKSALLRAIKTVARNAPTPDFVTLGKKHSTIRLVADDAEIVLERGKALSTYRVLRDGHEAVYTKSGTGVPEEIAAILQMPETQGELLNFAFQFDRPFLLDSPATKVAQVLGELTNITVILDAVREANRRRLEVSARLKVRRGDLERLRGEVEAVRGVKERQAQLEELRGRLESTITESQRLDQLSALWTAWTVADTAVRDLVSASKPVSDLTVATSMAEDVERLTKLVAEARMLAAEARAAKSDVERLRAEAESLHEQHHAALKDARSCPLCGATT